MNDLRASLIQLGIDREQIENVLFTLEQYKDADWIIKKEAIVTKIKELQVKFELGGCTRREVVDLAIEIESYFDYRERKGLKSSDVQMINKLPERRYSLKVLHSYGNATMGLTEGFHLIAAEDNVGKTGIIIQIMVDVLMNNPESSVLFVTLDDAGKKLANRFLACIGFYLCGNINLTSTINFASSKYINWLKQENIEKQNIKNEAQSVLRGFLDSGRLVVEQGDFLPSDIKQMAQKMKFKPLVVIDAIYNMNVGESNNERVVEDRQAKFPKKLSIEYGLPVLCVKEIRKSSQFGADTEKDGSRKRLRPGVNDIGGSKMWKHEPDTIAMMWSEKRMVDELGDIKAKEITLMSLAKSKVDSLTPVINLNYYKDRNVMVELSEA